MHISGDKPSGLKVIHTNDITMENSQTKDQLECDLAKAEENVERLEESVERAEEDVEKIKYTLNFGIKVLTVCAVIEVFRVMSSFLLD